MIYFDIDDVVRNLNKLVFGKTPTTWNTITPEGVSLYTKISKNLNILEDSPTTEYYETIKKYAEKLNRTGDVISFITIQPKPWRPYTENWMTNHFNNFKINYADHSDEKLKFLENKEDILIEDSPNFHDYSQIALIVYTYNKHVLKDYKPYASIYTVKDLVKLLNLEA